MDDEVHEAMFEQELRALEAGRQLLADRSRTDPRAGKANEGVRFRQVDVTEHGI